jgi:hypothetical protein
VNCITCNQPTETISALVNGKYYPNICRNCKHDMTADSNPSSGVASFTRRREFEDFADATVQPYTASGPNPEFYRLYPKQSEKIFNASIIEKLKRKM